MIGLKMCFSIPVKVKETGDHSITVENGIKIIKDKHLIIKKGDYVMVSGGIVVGSLSQKEGLAVRKLIKKVYNS